MWGQQIFLSFKERSRILWLDTLLVEKDLFGEIRGRAVSGWRMSWVPWELDFSASSVKCLKVDFGNHNETFGHIQMASDKIYFSKVNLEVHSAMMSWKDG